MAQAITPQRPPSKNMVWIPGGTFRMGSDVHYPEEAPSHEVSVGDFWIDTHPVTNLEWKRFVKATGYITLAERAPSAEQYPDAKPEMLVPGSVVFRRPRQRVSLDNHYNWWVWVAGADWRHPEGPGSNLDGRERHPVVQVAWEDVEAYARWAGKALPTEAEWEYAARGGLDGAEYCWGDEWMPRGRPMANTWQGEFPVENLLLDKFERTSPVQTYPPNGYGIYDAAGNVWEWTADWYQDYAAVAQSCCAIPDPRGGEREASVDPAEEGGATPRKVLKGGSYLCAPNYCRRYRPAARIPQTIDTSTGHVGFRCVVRVGSERMDDER